MKKSHPRMDAPVTSRHMLPIFKVVSDLDDPRFTNRELVFPAGASERRERQIWGVRVGEQEVEGARVGEQKVDGERVGEQVVWGARPEVGGRGNGGDREGEWERQRGKSKLSVDYDRSVERIKKQKNIKGHKCKKYTKSKRARAQFSPEKLNFSANFTKAQKVFDVSAPAKRSGLFSSMRNDQHSMKGSGDEGLGKQLDNFESMMVNPSDNPTYEDPRDLVEEERFKSKRSVSDVSKMSKEEKALLREQKKRLTKKYESLIVGLMDRCEDNMAQLSEKQTQLLKMKEKLKVLHAYNNQFADENDRLKRQQAEAAAFVAQCRDAATALDTRNAELERRVRELEGSGREPREEEGVRLVEVCMACNTREILVRQLQQQNGALQRDIAAMKDVIYRLNIQLSRYQEKLRKKHEATQNLPHEEVMLKVDYESKGPVERVDYSNIFESLNKANLEGIESGQAENDVLSPNEMKPQPVQTDAAALDANALAPLFEAYQESIREKDNLILDYEKQFSNFNHKMKQVLQEKKQLGDKLAARSEELSGVRDSLKRSAAERESSELDKAALAERTEKAERKLKEVYELYEDKVAAMSRDYELVHREYLACRAANARAEGRLAQQDASGARTVPADMHERALYDCKRLFEELKHQYGLEREKREEQLSRLRERGDEAEERLRELRLHGDKTRTELRAALKNVRLYRRAAVIFRARLRASVASLNSVRRSRRRARLPAAPTLTPDMKAALEKVERIKVEIQTVKASAYRELAEVERRMRWEREAAARAAQEHARDMQRMQLLLEHKESIIRKLIDQVELRPYASEYNSHRVQAAPSDTGGGVPRPQTSEAPRHQSSGAPRPQAGGTPGHQASGLPRPQASGAPRPQAGGVPRVQAKRGSVRLVPAPGGYFQEARDDRRPTGSKVHNLDTK